MNNTAISNRKSCINVPTASYTGKESSPLRYGISAEGFDIGYEKEGFDKNIWYVKIKNNKKVWSRKYNIDKIVHEEPVILDIVKEEIKEDKEEKKITDYNKFLSYYLNKLKTENVNKLSNKILFAKTMDEWKRLKQNPSELKDILDIITSSSKI
jgi:hypothetical protein